MSVTGDPDHSASASRPLTPVNTMGDDGLPPTVQIGGAHLTIQDLVRVARLGESVAPLSETSARAIARSAEWVEKVIQDVEAAVADGREHEVKAYYGINTGFGALAGRSTLTNSYLMQVLSRNLITSHSVGVGEFFDDETVRAAMLLRAHSLAQGYSGVRAQVIETLRAMINNGLYPAIPSQGSLGASGDLAPLSHLALAMSAAPDGKAQGGVELDDGPGEIFEPYSADQASAGASSSGGDGATAPYHITTNRATGKQTLWRRSDSRKVLAAHEIEPLVLRAKEGLALNNGATFSAALAALTLYDACQLFKHATLALSLSLEGMRGFRDPFLPVIHRVRRHKGAQDTAAAVLRLVDGSSLLDAGSHTQDPQRIPPQDPYSLRCAPQVHGSVLATLRFVHDTIESELNAATDNPLIFTDSSDLNREYRTVSGGNFHGEPIALGMDFLGIAMTELGSIAERRIFKMTDYHFAKPDAPATGEEVNKVEAAKSAKIAKAIEIAEATELQDFLIDELTGQVGLSSGFMIAQYTAASLVSDCKTLAHPDSVDSIPSSADKEDHVSMSLNAARHARMIVDNVEAIVAIELLSAAQAVDLQSAKPEFKCAPGAATAGILGQGTKGAYLLIREHIRYLRHDRVLVHDVRRMIQLMRSGDLVRATGLISASDTDI